MHLQIFGRKTQFSKIIAFFIGNGAAEERFKGFEARLVVVYGLGLLGGEAIDVKAAVLAGAECLAGRIGVAGGSVIPQFTRENPMPFLDSPELRQRPQGSEEGPHGPSVGSCVFRLEYVENLYDEFHGSSLLDHAA